MRPHQADSDAYATALLLLSFKQKLLRLPVMTLKQLHRLSFSLQSEVSELIEDCITFKLSKPEEYLPNLITYRGLAFKRVEESLNVMIRKKAFHLMMKRR